MVEGQGKVDMKKKKKAKATKLLNTAARRREAGDLVRFIDAHGGKLGAFRGYGVRPPSGSGDGAAPCRP